MSLEGRLMYKGFEAWIAVDEKPLPLVRPVYTEARDDATAWIASEEGKVRSNEDIPPRHQFFNFAQSDRDSQFATPRKCEMGPTTT
jgi:hypothetical protein